MLVNKTVEFFLSEAADWDWRSAGASSGLGADEMPAGTEAEQTGSSERPETGRDAGGG